MSSNPSFSSKLICLRSNLYVTQANPNGDYQILRYEFEAKETAKRIEYFDHYGSRRYVYIDDLMKPERMTAKGEAPMVKIFCRPGKETEAIELIKSTAQVEIDRIIALAERLKSIAGTPVAVLDVPKRKTIELDADIDVGFLL
ncbi:hypothetical protein ACYPKM_03885 [Pseudomonas aeruginosa]